MKNKKRQTGVIWAVILILTGLVILLSSLDIITITENIYFFVIIAIIAVVFHVACFINKPKRFTYLVPGGMLLVYSALFIACEYSPSLNLDELWPVIILAVAFGMLEQKVFSKGAQGSWASIIVVSVIGFYFLIQINFGFGIALGTLLIIAGLMIVIRLAKQLSDTTDTDEKKPQDTEFDDL